MFVRHVEINSCTQKSNRIYMNWWYNFTFKRKGRNISDLPLSITIDLDLEALKDILAQIRATAQGSQKTWVARIDGNIKNILSMKALTGFTCDCFIDFIFCNSRDMFYDNIYCR